MRERERERERERIFAESISEYQYNNILIIFKSTSNILCMGAVHLLHDGISFTFQIWESVARRSQ